MSAFRPCLVGVTGVVLGSLQGGEATGERAEGEAHRTKLDIIGASSVWFGQVDTWNFALKSSSFVSRRGKRRIQVTR